MPAPLSDIPVHVITGFLGSGKSSLIRHLLDHQPPGERWAVLVNEFGQVGIDQALFAGRDGVVVKALPGGCLCCQLAVVMRATLVELLRRERPDRLIIEPSGLGHPAGLLALLGGEAFAGVLEVREVVAVLDPRRLDDPRARAHSTFRDQLALADGVVLTMTDLASAEQQAAACAWLAAREEGPAPWVAKAPHGRLPVERVLGGTRHRETPPLAQPASHHALAESPTLQLDLDAGAPAPGAPVRATGSALGYDSLGWRWHPAEVFAMSALMGCLDGLPAEVRVKGVLHTEAGWQAINRVRGDEPPTPCEWRRDSRLELIAPAARLPQVEALDAALRRCLVGSEPGR